MSWDTVNFAGMAARYVTAEPGGTWTKGTHEGKSCYMHTDGKVYVGAANKPLFGVAGSISDKLITVQDAGYVTVPYTSTAPTVGSFNKLECGASGAVAIDDTNGVPIMVVSVDTDASTCVIKLG